MAVRRTGRRTRNARGATASSGGMPGIALPSRSGSARSSSRPYGCDGRGETSRRAELDDPAGVEQREPAAEPLGETEIVRDDDERGSAGSDVEQPRGGGVDEIGVEPGGRLVGDDDIGLADAARSRRRRAAACRRRVGGRSGRPTCGEVEPELSRAGRTQAPPGLDRRSRPRARAAWRQAVRRACVRGAARTRALRIRVSRRARTRPELAEAAARAGRAHRAARSR